MPHQTLRFLAKTLCNRKGGAGRRAEHGERRVPFRRNMEGIGIRFGLGRLNGVRGFAALIPALFGATATVLRKKGTLGRVAGGPFLSDVIRVPQRVVTVMLLVNGETLVVETARMR